MCFLNYFKTKKDEAWFKAFGFVMDWSLAIRLVARRTIKGQ